MTEKTLKVGIASYEEMKDRTLRVARGELKPGPDEPKVWFTSAESFAKVLSDRNRALLAEIAAGAPASLAELAARTGRQKSNLSRTLKTLARYASSPCAGASGAGSSRRCRTRRSS